MGKHIQKVRKIMNQCADNGTTQFISAIRPIYGSTESGEPDHMGTCILLDIKNNKYLLTAAHILDNNEYSSLYVGGNTLVLIENEFNLTKMPQSGRQDDHYDFAWCQLSDDFICKLGDVSFVSEGQISSNHIGCKGKFYLALGYPNTQNKNVSNSKKTVTSNYMSYLSTIKHNKKFCKKLGISGEDHIFLDYSKYSKDSNGLKVSSFAPRGVSGGAIIYVGNIVNPERLESHLAGMLIEYHKDYQIMLAVKISIVINEILKVNPPLHP